jgi:hypothetical protein
MKILFIIIALFSITIIYSQEYNTFGEDENTENEYIFVMRLMPDMSNNLFQLGIKKANSSEDKEIIYLSVESWVRQLVGIEASKANLSGENFIIKHKIFDLSQESITSEEIDDYTVEKVTQLLNNLWRIKYSEYPYYNVEKNNEKGWAKHPDPNITWLPSESQINILRGYGIKEINDFFIGDDLFRFLRDIHDSEWQNRYIQSAGVYNTEP